MGKHKKHSREDKNDLILEQLRQMSERMKDQENEIHQLKRNRKYAISVSDSTTCHGVSTLTQT